MPEIKQNFRSEDKFETVKYWLSSPSDLRIYLLVAMFSLIFLFISIWEIKPVTVDLYDFLGLTSHLTLAYWLGYILIILLSFKIYLDNKIRKSYIYIIILFIFGLFLFGVPVFAEENARFPWSYYPAGEVKNVLATKYIDSISEFDLQSYRSWPATHLISASILYIVNIKIETLLKYMPLFWMFSVALITFSIGKRLKFQAQQSFLLSLISLSSFWIFHYYYGPQSLVYILLLLSILFILPFSEKNKTNYIVLILLTFVAVVITHLLTSIALISSFVFSSLFISSIRGKRIKFILLFMIILFAWYIYFAPYMFEKGVEEIINQIENPSLFSFVKTDKYSAGELFTRQITHYSRLSYLGVYAISLVATVALFLTGKIKKENKELMVICFAWLIGIFMMFVFRYGASEIDDRIYIFSIMPLALIAILSFDKKILIILSLLLIIPHIPAHYGSESYDLTRTTELRGAEFFAEKVPDDKNPIEKVTYTLNPFILFYDSNKIYMEWVSYTGAYKPNISRMDDATYVVDSRESYNFMMYSHGFDPVQTWAQLNQKNIHIIYNNGDFKIYKKVLR